MKTLFAVAVLMLTVGIAQAQMICRNGRCYNIDDGFGADTMFTSYEPEAIRGPVNPPRGYHTHRDPNTGEVWTHSDRNVGNSRAHESPYSDAYVTRRVPERRWGVPVAPGVNTVVDRAGYEPRYAAPAPVAYGGCVGTQSRAVYQQSPYQQVSYAVAAPQTQYVVQQQQQQYVVAAPQVGGCIGNKRTAQYLVPQVQSYTVTIPAKQVMVTVPEEQVTIQLPQPQIEVIPTPQLEQTVVVPQMEQQVVVAPQVTTTPCPCYEQQVVVQQQQFVDPCYPPTTQYDYSPYAFEGIDPGNDYGRSRNRDGIDIFDSDVNVIQQRARCGLFQRLREGRAARLANRADRVASRVIAAEAW